MVMFSFTHDDARIRVECATVAGMTSATCTILLQELTDRDSWITQYMDFFSADADTLGQNMFAGVDVILDSLVDDDGVGASKSVLSEKIKWFKKGWSKIKKTKIVKNVAESKIVKRAASEVLSTSRSVVTQFEDSTSDAIAVVADGWSKTKTKAAQFVKTKKRDVNQCFNKEPKCCSCVRLSMTGWSYSAWFAYAGAIKLLDAQKESDGTIPSNPAQEACGASIDAVSGKYAVPVKVDEADSC